MCRFYPLNLGEVFFFSFFWKTYYNRGSFLRWWSTPAGRADIFSLCQLRQCSSDDEEIELGTLYTKYSNFVGQIEHKPNFLIAHM